MKRAVARYRAVLALQMAAEGRPYDDIAAELGFAHRSGAWNAVQRALDRQEADAAGRYRDRMLAEIDMVQEKAWKGAMDGDPEAGAIALQAIDARCRLLRL